MYLNECTLLGTLARAPEARTTDSGREYLSAALKIEEPGDARTYTTFVPVQAFGKSADVLRGLEADQLVLVRGKLGWRSWQREGKREGRLEVIAWTVQALTPPPQAAQN